MKSVKLINTKVANHINDVESFFWENRLNSMLGGIVSERTSYLFPEVLFETLHDKTVMSAKISWKIK